MSGGGGYLLSGIVVDNTDPEGYQNGTKKVEKNFKRQKTDS